MRVDIDSKQDKCRIKVCGVKYTVEAYSIESHGILLRFWGGKNESIILGDGSLIYKDGILFTSIGSTVESTRKTYKNYLPELPTMLQH